jgi:hypothetical protein
VSDERPTFETRAEAEAFCREREADEPNEASWLPFQADGRWTAVRTNLPRHEDPLGSATEAKPKPPDADDPRSASQRDIGPYVP